MRSAKARRVGMRQMSGQFCRTAHPLEFKFVLVDALLDVILSVAKDAID
jgi:hypothetical protein